MFMKLKLVLVDALRWWCKGRVSDGRVLGTAPGGCDRLYDSVAVSGPLFLASTIIIGYRLVSLALAPRSFMGTNLCLEARRA